MKYLIKNIKLLMYKVWKGITRIYHWLTSTLSNIFNKKTNPSNKKNSSPLEENKQTFSRTQEKPQVSESYKLEQSIKTNSITYEEVPDQLRAAIHTKLDQREISSLNSDVDTLELMKKYPNFLTILINNNSLYTDKWNREDYKNFKSCLNRLDIKTFQLFEDDKKIREILNTKLSISTNLVSFLNNLAKNYDKEVLNRIRNHPELAKTMINSKNYFSVQHKEKYTELFKVLFFKEQEDILEKLEYDLEFTTSILTVPSNSSLSEYKIGYGDVTKLIYMMSCLKNKEDVELLLKPIFLSNYYNRNQSIHENARNHSIKEYISNHFFVTCEDSSFMIGDTVYNQYEQIISKFFEHLYNNRLLYETFIKLQNDGKIKNTYFGVNIIACSSNFASKEVDYDEDYKYYKLICDNDNYSYVCEKIDKVLNEHKERMLQVLKKENQYSEFLGLCTIKMIKDLKVPLDAICTAVEKGKMMKEEIQQPKALTFICLEEIAKNLLSRTH